MKREIKFRAWYENKMHRVISYHIETGMVTIPLMRFPFTQDVVPDAVVEYTGLKDKDGKEIYEGDILEFDPDEWGDNVSNKGSVEWDSKNAEWMMGGGTSSECSEYKTIIGNIYENPGL